MSVIVFTGGGTPDRRTLQQLPLDVAANAVASDTSTGAGGSAATSKQKSSVTPLGASDQSQGSFSAPATIIDIASRRPAPADPHAAKMMQDLKSLLATVRANGTVDANSNVDAITSAASTGSTKTDSAGAQIAQGIANILQAYGKQTPTPPVKPTTLTSA